MKWWPRRRKVEPVTSNAYDLWVKADGDREEYRRLLREAGLIRPLAPGEEPEPLPCGWPGPSNGTVTDDVWTDDLADESLRLAREHFAAGAETWPEWDGDKT